MELRKGILSVLLFASILVAAPADAHFLGCDSVDSGEIRYGGSTQWGDAKNHGVSVWDALGSVNVAPDVWNTIEDLTWSDVHRADVTWAGQFTCYSGSADTIKLNEHYMTVYSTNQRRNVASHELGHALGLDHSYSGQLMYQYVSTVTYPQSHDIADYRSLWG